MLRQIEWTDEFYSSVHSFLPEHRPSTLSLGRMASCGRIAIAQPFHHRLCRRELGSIIEVGVNIGGGGEVAVTQPFLNLLHGNAVCQKKAGAAMAQIVEADRTQTVFLQQLRELLGNVVGADDVPNLVHTQMRK